MRPFAFASEHLGVDDSRVRRTVSIPRLVAMLHRSCAELRFKCKFYTDNPHTPGRVGVVKENA